jgi:hypothetical protein
MRLNTLGRFLGALCLAGSMTYVAAAPASASTPNWHMTAVPDPGIVANGADVAYLVHIWNEGPSNISTLYLSTVTNDVPVYLVNDPNYPACQSGTTAKLNCALGSLAPSDDQGGIWLTVGYQTGGASPYNPQFLVNSNGFTKTDKKNTSHGDTLGLDPNLTIGTGLRSDGDFGGGFVLNQNSVGNNGTLGKNNPQSTAVTPPVAFIPVTVEDALADAAFPDFSCASLCGSRSPFGQWSRVNVNHDQDFGTTFFPVTLMFYGKSLPSTISKSNIQLIHTNDTGGAATVLPQCAQGAALENCIQVTQVGGNFKVVAWVDHNGGFKGMG